MSPSIDKLKVEEMPAGIDLGSGVHQGKNR